jgi:hypothetical protein
MEELFIVENEYSVNLYNYFISLNISRGFEMPSNTSYTFKKCDIIRGKRTENVVLTIQGDNGWVAPIESDYRDITKIPEEELKKHIKAVVAIPVYNLKKIENESEGCVELKENLAEVNVSELVEQKNENTLICFLIAFSVGYLISKLEL